MSSISPLARVRLLPNPSDWADDEPMTLVEIIHVFYPNGPLTVSSLRSSINKGLLPRVDVAGKLFVTPAQLRAMFRPTPCPAPRKVRASTSGEAAPTAVPANDFQMSISSETDRLRSAQAAAQMALQALSKPSMNTSPTNGRQSPPADSGQVIPLRSSSRR